MYITSTISKDFMKKSLHFDCNDGKFSLTQCNTLLENVFGCENLQGTVETKSLKNSLEADIDEIMANYSVSDIINTELIMNKVRTELDVILSMAHSESLNQDGGKLPVKIVNSNYNKEEKTIDLDTFSSIVTGLMDTVCDSMASVRAKYIKNQRLHELEEVDKSIDGTNIVMNINFEE